MTHVGLRESNMVSVPRRGQPKAAGELPLILFSQEIEFQSPEGGSLRLQARHRAPVAIPSKFQSPEGGSLRLQGLQRPAMRKRLVRFQSPEGGSLRLQAGTR